MSSGRFLVPLLLVVLGAPFVIGVTCNSQNVIGLPYLFIGLEDLSLVDFRKHCSFWFSISSMFSVFIESLLPFWSTTVIVFGSSSVVGLAFISSPGVGVVFGFLSLISFFRPLSYTGLIVVFSISSVLSSTFFSCIGVLHLSECSAVTSRSSVSSSSCPCCRNLPSFPSGFLPVVIVGSEILVSMVCLFVFYGIFCFYRLL